MEWCACGCPDSRSPSCRREGAEMMGSLRLRRPPGGWAVAWTAFLLLALLLWSVVYPNAAIIVGSFERGLGDWRDFMASPADREALYGTVVVSIGSVIGALLVGVPLAFL